MGKVAEGPGSCFFMVKGGKIVTPCLTDSVLESITRDTVIKIARNIGLEVEKRTIDRTELYLADEAFLCGSAMEITPIYAIDHYSIGTNKLGEITQSIRLEYFKIVRGMNEKYIEWLTPIY